MNILYKKTENDKKEKNLKDKLILKLADNLTAGQMLYSTLAELVILDRKIENSKTPEQIQQDIDIFFQKHAENVGFSQAISDLQTGLSILNKNRRKSPIEAKNILKQDGIYGEKTKAAFKNVCKNYKAKTIKKYILKGILNNIIFDTKNEKNINTQKMIDDVLENLKEE